MKRFRAGGDFLLRAFVNSITTSRTQIHRVENALAELEMLASHSEVPPEFLKALHSGRGNGLSDDQLRERLDKLKAPDPAGGQGSQFTQKCNVPGVQTNAVKIGASFRSSIDQQY